MSSEKYIENVTIQYLLNPNLQNQIIKNNTILSKDFNDDVKFYKKRAKHVVWLLFVILLNVKNCQFSFPATNFYLKRISLSFFDK